MWLYDAFLFLLVMVVCLFVLCLGELGRKRRDLLQLYGRTEGVGTVDPKDRVVLGGLLLIISHVAIRCFVL